MHTITIPVISTAHLTYATDQLLLNLGDANPWTAVAPYSEGLFVYVQSEDMDGQPLELSHIFAWARKLNYQWVRIDADGDHVDGLPIYEWDTKLSGVEAVPQVCDKAN
ncbi:hypothetical protein [Burkholderia cepacia]|uniref:DUF5983 family protein n=1 Tax=Burkholderia cepacia TaxID=292 RepID=UPI0006666CA4|nr:hypothetical protein [Burkholderia cepacia]